MRPATKVAFNTVFLYTRLVVSMAISLVSVPLVLKALGASDYGLYNLVAGVVTMLSFLTSSMTVSSQRYLSVTMGTMDKEKVDSVFNVSFFIHLLLAIFVVSVFEIGTFFISRLNIPSERIGVAIVLYQLLILNTFISIIKVPFEALINAHEDMLVFSVIGIIDAAFKLGIAIALFYINFDRLIFYGLGVVFVTLFTFLMLFLWTKHSYKGFQLKASRFKDKSLLKEMTGFAGWNLFGGIAVMGRNQGVAIIINLFLGTIANAAYGIANQINGALSDFSAVLPKALNPQLMKSEGMNDRSRLIRISFISSRVSVLAFSIFAVPLILEMPEVLKIWLGINIPPYTEKLSQLILLFSILYQYSNGLMSSIQATGIIRNYQITMGLLILTNIPLSYVILKFGYPIYYVTAAFVVVELVSLIVRIFMARKIVGLNIYDYVINVVKPTVIIVGGATIAAIIPHILANPSLIRFALVCSIYLVSFVILSWFFAFEGKSQRNVLISEIREKVFQMKNRRKI
jgi:O-antigen/teichoic acid export membrane protein